MNNFAGSLKKIITNRNTVTIIGTLVGILILYFGYTWRINQQVDTVSVLVANQNIQPRTKITEDMVETVEIARVMYDKMMDSNSNAAVLRTSTELKTAFVDGAYSNINALIPKGSVLIKNTNVVDYNKIPSSVLTKIEEGQIPYAFSINYSDTYGNAIMDGMYVNIYMRATSDDGKTMFGKFLGDVKVLAVLDSSGRDVFENTEESRTPSTFIFSVDEEYHLLLRKAKYLGIELVPVPVTESVTDADYKGDIQITSSYLKDYIEQKTVNVPEDQLPETTDEDKNTSSNKSNSSSSKNSTNSTTNNGE